MAEYLKLLDEKKQKEREAELYQLPDQYTEAFNAVNNPNTQNMEQAK